MSEWQSIETAPKDGTVIIAFDPHWAINVTPCVFIGECDEDYNQIPDTGEWHGFDDMGGGPIYPTHWMPLPEEPSQPSDT